MADLWAAAGIVAAGSAALFLAGHAIGRRAAPGAAGAAAAAGLGFVIAYALLLQDDLLLARLLPFPTVVVFGNALPLGAGLLAGLAWGRIPGGPVRKCLTVVPLSLVALRSLVAPILGSPPPCGDAWQDSVCLQTSEASCSAASAATILRLHGIPATEAEMADLCLTRESGTTMLGLYRGLKRKTAGTAWDAEAFSGTAADLRAMAPRPAILEVGLPAGAPADPRYARDWGWAPGVSHTVVFLGFLPGARIQMGDPSVGREAWHESSLPVLWRGRGIRLVRRDVRPDP